MSKQKIKQAYEELAESYNALIDHKPHNAYYDRPNTLSLIETFDRKKVLDAACGPGKYAEELIARGAHVTGLDISPQMINYAEKRNNDNSTFFVHDLSEPMHMLENGTFDIVLCALAMHYLKDWSKTVREFHRVLRPDGYLVISIEHPFFEYNYFNSKKYFEVEPVKCTWSGFGKPIEIHSYRRSLSECISSLTDNGFYIDKLLEPKPVKEFEKLDPRHYKELNEFPAFMCIRAHRKLNFD